MNRNINDATFFIETMPLYQRIDTKTADRVVRYIQDNQQSKNIDEELEILLDRIELENFICETQNVSIGDKLSEAQIKNVEGNIIDTYFLEKSRYERYYKPFSKSREEFEEKIEKFVKISDGEKTVDTVVSELLESLNQQREVINSQAKGRDRFSFIKYNRELISRSKKIHDTLKLNGIELDKDITLEGVLTRIAKEVVEVYNKEVEDIGYLNPKEQIDHIAYQARLNAVSFDNIRNELEDSSKRTLGLEESNDKAVINKLSPLSASVNAGTDYEKRIIMRFRDCLIGDVKKRNAGQKIRTAKERENLTRELSENELFKKELRDVVVGILEVSEVDVNSSTKSLFLNPHEVINGGSFALDKDMVKSFLNITISTENDNLKVLKVLANLETMQGGEVLSVINSLPVRKIRELQKKSRSNSYSEAEKKEFEKEIQEINQVKEDFEVFREKYAEYINSFIEEEFLKILNYSIYVYGEDKAISEKPGVTVNVKEKYKYVNSEICFQNIEEVVEMIDILLFLKKNERFLNPKFTGLTAAQVEEVQLLLKNFAVKSFVKMSEATIEKILDNREKLLESMNTALVKPSKKKKAKNNPTQK